MSNQHALEKEYGKLSAKFHQRSLREKLLILICGLVVLILLMYTLLFEPLIDSSHKLKQNTQNNQKELNTMQSQMALLTDKLQNDPNAAITKRIEVLNDEIHNITIQLETQTDNLIPANKMAAMLENVLAGSKGLRLIELQSIDPVPIILEPEEKSGAELYRHGVTMLFEGKYFDIQQYLEELESLPWKFYWKKFDYVVGDYPSASVELEIYTLSSNKAFIGV